MPLFGKIVVIRRDGVDGAQFPLTTGTCIFGRNADCDIRVQLPNVAKEHCRIEVESNGNIFLVNLCPVYPTLLNKKPVTERVQVQHLDVFTVTDRSFRVEFPPGSPFRKSCPSTDSVSPTQPTGPVKSESIPEPFAVQPGALMVKDEKSLPSISTNAEQSAAEKESSPRKVGIKYTPKGRTPTAKARTPGYPVRTPLQKGNAASPAVRSSAKPKTKTPTSASRGSRTPLVGQRNANARTGGTSTATPTSKSSISLSKSNSSLLADEIAELKLALTKAKGQTPARTSVPKTPVGTGHFSGATVKAKTPAAGDKTKTPSLTPRVRSNLAPTPKSKTLVSASVLKTPAVTLAAKTPLTLKSKGLAAKTSSVHRIKKVMTPSPKAKTQRRRSSSSVPSHVTEITRRPPLRNIAPQADSLDVSHDQQQETVESTLETSLGDKTSSEPGSFAGEKSPSQKLSPAKTFGPKTGSSRLSSASGPSTPQASLSPVIQSSVSALTRRKLHSPSKSSPQKMLQSAGKTLTAKRRSSSVGADKFAKDTPPYEISSAVHVEAVNSSLEISLRDKSSDEAVSSDGESPHSPVLTLTPAEGHARRKSRSSKVSSPGEPVSRVRSHSPNVGSITRRKTPSPLTRSSRGNSLTRSESQSPLGGRGKSRSPRRGPAESSPDKVVPESVETPVMHQRSSARRSVAAKQSPLPGISDSPLTSSAESAAEKQSQVVESPALPRRSSNRASVAVNQSPVNEVLSDASAPAVPEDQVQVVQSIEASSRRKSESSLAKSPSSSTRSRPQSPLGGSAELSTQKKWQSSQMSPVGEDNAKRELQSELGSPTDASQSLSQSLTKSSTRSKSQSPRRPRDAPSTRRSLPNSTDSSPDSLNRRKLSSPKESPGETSSGRKSQCLEVSTPSGIEDGIPAVTDDCFLESYDQQFSPLVLEMDDVDEMRDSPKKTTPIVGPKPKGISDPESLKSAVGRLRRKSQPLLEESEDENFSAKTAGKENDTSDGFDETLEERSFVSPSQGVKRRGGPLKGLPKKRRCVSFGPDVSPELFDGSLPVATPLKRGATPRRTSASVVRLAIQSKPLLKNRRSTLSTAATVQLEAPLDAKRTGKSPKDLKVPKKLSKGVGQSPVLDSATNLNAEAAIDLKPSQPTITPLRRQTKPRRASVIEAVVSPKVVRKTRRATLPAPSVTAEATPLEEDTEKSQKISKVQGMEGVVVVNVMVSVDAEASTASEIQTPVSSVVSSVAVGSQNRKIFTSGTGGKRLSRALKTPPATEVANSNENSPAVKSARMEKTAKLHSSLSPRSSHPLTNMQNSSVLHQEADPFAFESSPETSPTKLTPKSTGRGKSSEIDTPVSEDLATGHVLQSVKKKLQEEVTTPKVPLDFTVAGSSTALLKSLRSVGRSSVKDVGLEQEDELQETPTTTIITEGLRSTGRRSSKPQPVNEVVYETPTETTLNISRSTGRRSSKPVNELALETAAETTPNIPRSTGRRSSRLPDKENEKHSAKLTPVMDKSTSRRSKSSSNLPSAKTDLKTTSEQDSVLDGKRSKSCDSAAKTPRSTVGKRGQTKSEENLKTPDVEMSGKASAASPALPSGEGASAKRRFSVRTSSSPFKRPFDSEPRKLRLGQVGDLFRHSPEEAKRAARSKHTARQMISERNIDLSSLSPLKFYKSPAADALTGKWSKATPSRAVALRAVYGKSAVPPLAELRVSRKVSEMTDADKSEMPGAAAESLPVEKSRGSKFAKKKKSSLQVAAKKNLEKKTGFAVKKKKPTKVLLKRVGRRSVGQIVKKLVPARKRNLLQAKSNSAQEGQIVLPNIAENEVLEVLPMKGKTVAESSKSPSHSVLITPNGPGEMSVSPWSSPVLVSSGKRRSGGKTTVAVETSKGQNSPSSVGPKRILASPRTGDSRNLSGMNLTVEKSPVESSPELIGVRQLVKTSDVEVSPQLSAVKNLKVQKSPQLSGVKKLVKTPKVQKSPQLSGVRNLVKTPKVQKSPKLGGVRNLVKTPKVQKSPKLSGVRNLVKTPKAQKSPKLSGLRNLLKTPKPEKSPKLIGVRNMVKTPKVQNSPKLSGVRELVKTPKVQKSPQMIGVKKLIKTPRVQKSPQLIGVKKLVKTPRVQKSPRLSGVKDLLRTPKVQESPDLTGGDALGKSPNQRRTLQLGALKNLASTPEVLSSPELKPMNELLQSPATQSSPQPSGICKKVKTPEIRQSAKRASTQKVVKTPKHKRSPRLGGVKAVVKTPKMLPTPKLSGLRNLVRTPKEIPSPQLEGVRELVQTPVVQQSAKKTSVKSPVESPEVIEFFQFLANLSSQEASAVRQVARKAKSANKSLKSSVTPVITEMKEPREVAALEDASPVRPVIRLQKRAVRAGAGKVKSIPQLSTEVGQNDASVGKDDKTAAVKQTRKRKIVESDEGPVAQKRRVDAETEDRADSYGKEVHSAVKKGRGSKKVAAETLTKPSEIKVTASASSTRGRSRKEEIEKSSALQVEKPQVMSGALLSSKVAGSRNSRSKKSKTAQVEQATVEEEENVPVKVEETVMIGARRQARSSKKDLPEEPAVKSEEKVKGKATVKGKGKAKQAKMQETGVDNVEVSITPATEESDGRRQGRAQRAAIKGVVQAEAVVSNPERKTKARGKAITTEVEEKVATEEATVEKTVESSAAVKVSNRRTGRAQADANEELNVQSKAIVAPERKGRAGAWGKTKQTEVEVNVEPSVKETAKIGSRQQVRSVKKGTDDKEVDIQTEGVVNKAGRKVGGGRGKAKTPLTEAVEENPEKTAEPNVRKTKQTAKKDEVGSVDAGVDKTVEVKRAVRGRKTKSDGDKAEGKGRAIASEEAALAVDDIQTSQSALAPSGRRGRKGAVVGTATSEAVVVTEVVQSSRKRKAKTVEEIAPAKSKKPRVEAIPVEAAKEASSPKPSKRASKKASTGAADKKVGNHLVTKNLGTADKELPKKPAGKQNKRNAGITKVSSTIDEEFKANSLEKKRGSRSSNKAKSAESGESPKRKITVTYLKQQNAIKQAANEVEPGRPRKVKFDVSPAPVANGLEKAAQSTARGRSGAAKRGSEDKAVSKELQTAKPKAHAPRSVRALKDTAPVSGKRALRATKK